MASANSNMFRVRENDEMQSEKVSSTTSFTDEVHQSAVTTRSLSNDEGLVPPGMEDF